MALIRVIWDLKLQTSTLTLILLLTLNFVINAKTLIHSSKLLKSKQFSIAIFCCNTRQCGGFQICTKCCDNAYVSGPGVNCSDAIQCFPKPLWCTNFDEGSKCCKSCQQGKYVKDCSCDSCMTNCQSCKNGTSCDKCNSGLFFNKGSCQQCPQKNCSECNVSACTACNPGFYLRNGVCTGCSDVNKDCDTCHFWIDGQNLPHYICYTCKKGFYEEQALTPTNGVFRATCKAFPPKCANFDTNRKVCTQCVPGAKMDYVKGTCN